MSGATAEGFYEQPRGQQRVGPNDLFDQGTRSFRPRVAQR